MPRVQIYILCRDRVSYLHEALQSILVQDYDDYEVVVSDNSEYDKVQALIQSKYPQIIYIRRQPTLQALEHFRVVISECTAEYSVLFHDDDVMMPDYVKCMVEALDQHPSISAVGCNAQILQGETLTEYRFMRSFIRPTLLYNPETFLQPYLGLELTGPAPFPGYMYRTSAITGLYLDGYEGGKYSDVTFLLKILRRGPILWLPEILMHYRKHPGNDSAIEVIGQRLRLLRYIYKETSITKKSKQISEFRYEHWRRWLLASCKNVNTLKSTRFRTVAKFVFLKSIEYLVSKPGFYLRVKNKLIDRCKRK